MCSVSISDQELAAAEQAEVICLGGVTGQRKKYQSDGPSESCFAAWGLIEEKMRVRVHRLSSVRQEHTG